MRLKNKTSIALSIANGYHWKTPFQLEKEKNKKKVRPNFQLCSIARLNRKNHILLM